MLNRHTLGHPESAIAADATKIPSVLGKRLVSRMSEALFAMQMPRIRLPFAPLQKALSHRKLRQSLFVEVTSAAITTAR